MLYQEKFELNDLSTDFFSSQFDFLITGFRDEDDIRHNHIYKSLHTFKGKILSLDVCNNADKLSYKLESGIEIESNSNQSLIPDLETLLKRLDVKFSSVCVDITNLKQGVLFLLIKILLKTNKPKALFAAYTEPGAYKQKVVKGIGEIEEFDLYSEIIGSSKGVPGFNKHRGNKPILLIASMGFDCQRLQTIYENLKPKKLIPVVGFPSFIPGWNLTAIKMNFMILKSAYSFDMIEPSEAASPFDFFELLKKTHDLYVSNYDIYISPLGTRPHCLGAALFASLYPSTYLIYDFPVEKKFRSENVLKSNIYNLSKYIE